MIKKTIYFSIATSFFAAQIFSLNLIFFQLSLFRLSIVLICLLVLLTLLKTSSSTYMIPKGENRYSIKFMIFWLFYSFVTLFWVKDYSASIRGIYFIFSGVTCAVSFSMFLKSKRHFWITLNIMQIMVLFHNFVGWYEIFSRDYRFISIDNLMHYSTTNNRIPISLLGNPNDFATLALFGISVAFICLKINSSPKSRLISRILIVSNAVLVVLSTSRANILGLVSMFAVYFILSRKTKGRVIAGFALITIALIFSVFSDAYYDAIFYVNKLLSFDFMIDSQYLNSEGVRFNLIRNGLYFLKETYGFGTGVGNIEYWMGNNALYYTKEITNIHNWWFEILVSSGVFVFIFYIIFYVKLFKNMLSVYKKSDDHFNKSIALGILLFMSAFVIASVSSSSNISKEWLWVYWSIVVAFQGYAFDIRKDITDKNGIRRYQK